LTSNPDIGIWYPGLCGECAAPLARQLGVETVGGFFSFIFSAFLGLVCCLLQARARMWSHQVTGLLVAFGSFCPQDRFQLGSELTHASSCKMFSPASSCIALQLPLFLITPPPARWGNSVLSTALRPTRPAQ
jgi:hypothetical protein